MIDRGGRRDNPSRTARRILALGAFSGAMGVLASAFGAHGLTRGFEAGTITAGQLRGFEVAAMQHIVHALALVGTGLAGLSLGPHRWLVAAAALFAFGTLAFAGPLYLYALTGAKPLIRLVPVGGMAFVLGWACLAVGAAARTVPRAVAKGRDAAPPRRRHGSGTAPARGDRHRPPSAEERSSGVALNAF